MQSICQDNPKMNLLCQTILRKQLITAENKLTTEGKELLAFFDQPSREKIVRVKHDEIGFENWWKEYPGTDTFTHKGKSFTGDRALKMNKDECRLRFNKIIAEGEHDVEMMIEALKFDVMQKKENSVLTKTNKLSYMQNSLTYLNQRTFESFIELIKEGTKVKETDIPISSVDI
jgi:hypothetical protein